MVQPTFSVGSRRALILRAGNPGRWRYVTSNTIHFPPESVSRDKSASAVKPDTRTLVLCQLAVATVTVAAWATISPPFYMTNDDVTIRMALEGRSAPGQPPTGFALMTHSVLGWALVGLGNAVPLIPWWDVMLAATLLCSVGVMVALLWSAFGPGWLPRSTAIGALMVAVVPYASSLQFTISATLAGGAAALLAATELDSTRPRRGVLVLASLLFFVGLLIRPMAAPTGAVTASLLLLPTAGRGRQPLVLALLCVIAALSFAGAQYVDAAIYARSAEWNDYLHFNDIVIGLEWFGDASTSRLDAIRSAAGWTDNDWMMLRMSLAVDPEIHGLDRVTAAYNAQAAVGWSGLVSSIWSELADAPFVRAQELLTNSWVVGVAAAAVVAGWVSRRGAVRAIAVFVFYLLIAFGIEVAFSRLPWRLLGPLQVIFAAAIVSAVGGRRRAPSPVLSIVSLGVLLSLLTPELRATTAEAADQHLRSIELSASEVTAVAQLSPSLVIFHSATFPRERLWQPFHPAPAALPAVALGWNNQNPQIQRYLTESGRQPLLRALCSDPSILLVADEERLEFVSTYAREHLGTTVEWTQVYKGSFPVWRCTHNQASPGHSDGI